MSKYITIQYRNTIILWNMFLCFCAYISQPIVFLYNESLEILSLCQLSIIDCSLLTKWDCDQVKKVQSGHIMPVGMCSTNVYWPTQTIHTHVFYVVVGSASGWDASKVRRRVCCQLLSLSVCSFWRPASEVSRWRPTLAPTHQYK